MQQIKNQQPTNREPMQSPTEKILAQRVEALEERLEQMRLSRKVLLRILEQSELERKTEVAKLKVENTKLQRQNNAFAHSLMEKNQTIVTLQNQIDQ